MSSPGRRTTREWRWLSPPLLLLWWEIGSWTGLIPARTLAAPSSIMTTMASMILSGKLPRAVAVSLLRSGIGLGGGVAAGVVLGLAAGLSRRGNAATNPLLQVKRTIPVVALSLLFIGLRYALSVAVLMRAIEARALAWRQA